MARDNAEVNDYMSDTSLEEKVDRLTIDTAEIRIALKGYNGNQGLIPAFEEHCKCDTEFRADYYAFKRKCLMIFCFTLGSGGLGVGIVKLLELL